MPPFQMTTVSPNRDLTKPIGSSPIVYVTPTIKLNNKQYSLLKEYIISRIKYAANATAVRAENYDNIDKQLLGSICLNKEDSKRALNNQKGKSAKVTDINLAVGQAQIDTCVTSLLNLLVPTGDMYEAYTTADKQSLAQGLAYEMTDHADKLGHITEFHKAFNDALKYNLCGLQVSWKRVQGNKLSNDELNGLVVENTTVYEGNKLKHLDMRNTFYPPHVAPEAVATEGQYAGYVEKVDNFKINELIDEAEIYGQYLKTTDRITNNIVGYNSKPTLQTPATGNKYLNADGTTNHDSLFSGFGNGAGADVNTITTLVTIFIKLRPSEFGLSKDVLNAIWEFKLLNNEIVYGKQLDNAHGNLPIVLTSATLDGLDDESPSYAELLIPLQNFSSYLLNVKQRAYRKQLYGVNFYDKDRVDMREALNKNEDKENLWIPVSGLNNQAIASFVQHYNDAPDTGGVMQDLSNTKALMQDLLPTDSRSLLANLSRVSQWQAQKTVSETDKRTIKLGRLLNATLMKPLKSMQVNNILQYKESITVLQDSGEYETIAVSDLRSINIELGISSALKGIDKDILADRFREMLSILVQMPHVTNDYDMTKALDYWSSLVGADIDLSQFKIKSAFDKLTPEQKQAAYQLLIQATAEAQAESTVNSAVNSMPPLTGNQ